MDEAPSRTCRALALCAVLCACEQEQGAAPADLSPRTTDLFADSADMGAPPAVMCAFTRAVSGGTLCAVQPSATNTRITDSFGYHAVALPAAITANTRLYVHFVGSGGDPARADTRSFPNATIMQEALAQGFLVLMPAYDNEPSVGSLCRNDVNCYEPVRREILHGTDAPAPYADLKDVQPPNHIDARLSALVAALKGSGALGAQPPQALAGDTISWGQARVGGHSQGGGHAGLIARAAAVERLCMLSAPIDGAQLMNRALPAAWTTATGWQTPLSRRRAVIHKDDDGYAKAAANFTAMGMAAGAHVRELSFATADPHGATVKATEPEPLAARLWACFQD